MTLIRIFESMSTVLVTGATGFIGQHLLHHLQTDTSLDIKATVRSLPSTTNPDISYSIIEDINSKTDWSEALTEVEIVIHLAARAHILDDPLSEPEKAFQRVNADGTLNLAKQSIKAGVKHFIFVSSIGAMTSMSETSLTEKSECNPDTLYGQSKLDAEIGLRAIVQDSFMSWTILRPTLVYGPGNPGNMERLIKLINLRLPLPLGAINNQRSFLYVGNLVDGIILCIDHPSAKNQIFIISDDQDLSTAELILYIGKALGRQPLLLQVPGSILKLIGKLTGQTKTVTRLMGSLIVDNHKIKRTLDWKPAYSISEGLEATCHWYCQQQTNH